MTGPELAFAQPNSLVKFHQHTEAGRRCLVLQCSYRDDGSLRAHRRAPANCRKVYEKWGVYLGITWVDTKYEVSKRIH